MSSWFAFQYELTQSQQPQNNSPGERNEPGGENPLTIVTLKMSDFPEPPELLAEGLWVTRIQLPVSYQCYEVQVEWL